MNILSTISLDLVDKLIEAYRHIQCCQDLEFEVNAGGNGYNAYEAMGGLELAFEALGLEIPTDEPTREQKIALLESYGEDPDDYEL